MDSLDDLINSIGGAVAEKFPRIKLKFRPGWDVPMLKAVRSNFPKPTFHIDCNSGYRLGDLPMFQAIDEFQLAMIEQPLRHDDVVDHAELQKQIATPVCLDESVSHPDHATLAIRLKSCQYVNIKPGRVGGLTNAVQIHDLCQAAGIPCWVGGMLESATGADFASRSPCWTTSRIPPTSSRRAASMPKTSPKRRWCSKKTPPACRPSAPQLSFRTHTRTDYAN